MHRTLLLLCSLVSVGCQITTCNVQVLHLQLNDAHLIETSANSWAITSPELKQNNWQTVSINGDNVIIHGLNCEQNIRTISSLSDVEKNAIQNSKQQLQASESTGVPATNSAISVARYSLDGNGVTSMSNSNSMHMSSFSNNHLSISRADDNNFVICKSGLPNNIAMILSMGTNVAFVYNDGQVQMKPSSCMQPAEQQLLQETKAEIQQTGQQFKSNMNEFQNHMRNMQQQMQQNMHNMQQQMRNNFGNMFDGGFPNNPAAASTGYGTNQNLNLGAPYASANVGPLPSFGHTGVNTMAHPGTIVNPASHSGAGFLGNLFNGITRQFQQFGGQRSYQSPVMQQSTGFWPFG